MATDFQFQYSASLFMLFASKYLKVFCRTTCMSIFEEDGQKKKEKKRKQAFSILLCTIFKLAKLISMQNNLVSGNSRSCLDGLIPN